MSDHGQDYEAKAAELSALGCQRRLLNPSKTYWYMVVLGSGPRNGFLGIHLKGGEVWLHSAPLANDYLHHGYLYHPPTKQWLAFRLSNEYIGTSPVLLLGETLVKNCAAVPVRNWYLAQGQAWYVW